MTAKERAINIIEKYKKILRPDNRSWEIETKQCALISVTEIIEQLEYINFPIADMKGDLRYWKKVKAEINKL